MSTVMYAFKVKKDILWETLDIIRKYYIENHPMHQAGKKYKESGDWKSVFDFIEKLDAVTAELQVFEFDDYYLLRPTKNGMYFLNMWEEFGCDIESCFYDNRTDISEEDLPNEAVVDAVDELIIKRRYMLYYIMQPDDFIVYA